MSKPLANQYYAVIGWLMRTRDLFYGLPGKIFDARHGVDTESKIALPDLDLPCTARPEAVGYQPTKIAVFLATINKLPAGDLEKFAFVDFGCGKGRCLLLATRFPFERIVGVDLSARLCDIAASNAAAYKSGRFLSRISLQTCHAQNAELPRRPTVYFFYNPFGFGTMSDVLNRIAESLNAAGAAAYAIYVNPLHERLFADAGFTAIAKGRTRGENWTIFLRPPQESE